MTKQLVLQPIVVPRAVTKTPSSPRLVVQVVWTAAYRNADGSVTEIEEGDALDLPNAEALRTFPEQVRKGLRKGDAHLHFLVRGQEHILPLAWEPLPELHDHCWSTAEAQQMWLALAGPALIEASKRWSWRRQSRVSAVYHRGPSRVMSNPRAISDLAPAHRIEAFDPFVAAPALFEMSFWRLPGITLEQLHEFSVLLAKERPAAFLKLITSPRAGFPEQPNMLREVLRRDAAWIFPDVPDPVHAIDSLPDGILSDALTTLAKLRGLSEAEATRFGTESLMDSINDKIVARIAKFYLARAIRDAFIDAGQPEAWRQQQFHLTARHRWRPDTHVSAQRSFAMQTQDELTQPRIDELLARLQKHPGVRRRLNLVFRGSVECPAGWDANYTEGTLALHWNWSGGGPSPFASPHTYPPTKFDLRLSAKEYFRAQPYERASFLERDEREKAEAWRTFHILPSKWYLATQDDLSMTASRALVPVGPSPAYDVTSAAAGLERAVEDQQRDHRLNAVSFYATAPATVKSLHDHRTRAFSNVQPAAEAMHERLVSGVSSQKSIAAKTSAPLYAEDLMCGHTVYVRQRQTDSKTYGPWRSLCRRIVQVRAGNHCWNVPEDGFLTTSALLTPPPLAGWITGLETVSVELREPGLDPYAATLPVACMVMVRGSRHQFVSRKIQFLYEMKGVESTESLVPSAGTEYPGDLHCATPVRGVFRRAHTINDLAVGDYIVVTAVETPADPAAAVVAQDVEVLPPLISRSDFVEDIRGMAVIRGEARGNSGETVPVLLRRNYTRYLNVDGVEVDPQWQRDVRFVASGEIRLVAWTPPSIDAAPMPPANTLVGEVIRVQEMLPDRFNGAQLRQQYRDHGLSAGDVIVELETVRGITKTVVFVNNRGLAPRSIADVVRNLEPGETVVVPHDGVFRPDPYPQTWFKATPGATVERQLRGTLTERPLPYNQVSFLGDPAWRCFEILTMGGRRCPFWHHDDSPEPLQNYIGKTVTVSVEPMIDATTILFPPSTSGVMAGSLDEFTAELPAHIRVSELLARWEGWSLTVPQPGHTDREQSDTSLVTAPYSLTVCRPDPATLTAANRDSWLLPRLRFDRQLQFVLRRTDLAGNHDFEEPELPTVLDATATAELESVIARSLGLTDAQLASFFQRNVRTPQFCRVDRPLPPLPAFPPDRIAIEHAVQPTPKPPEQRPEFRAVADQRAAVIVVVTDACCRDQHVATFADATLLPPATAVETAVMHGRLDGGAAAAAGSIRDHERYFDPDPDMLGLLKAPHGHGNLNYMPDPAATRVAFALELPASAGATPPEETAFLYAMNGASPKWPWAAGLKIALTANGVEERARPSLNYEVPTAAEPGGVVRVALPAATDARLVQYFIDPAASHDSAEWGQWRIVHATNGALMSPAWKALGEQEPVATGPRSFEATFELHRPSTGAWNVFAYWNEVWDEALPTQFRAAELLVTWDQDGKKVLAIDVAKSDPGMGYGREAVMVWESVPGEEPPTKLPRARASVVNGIVDSVAVLNGGEGVTAANVRPRLVRRPPLHRTAVANATVVAGRVTRVDVAPGQRGGWYVEAPHAILHDRTGQGSGAILQACLNECGGVEKVIVLDGGRCYSHDVEVRFYTHMERVRDVPVALCPQPDNPNTIDMEHIEFTASKPDERSHVVDFVLQADSRFYPDFLKAPAAVTAMDCDNPTPIVPAAHDVMIHVPRFSARRQIALRSRHDVPRPEVDHIIPAFVWRVDGAMAAAPESASLAGRIRGRIRIERQATIRVYLHRPWHTSGEEHLGVLVRPMVSDSPPQGVGTPPVESPVAYSRWGYDPVWSEAKFVPLAEYHFEYGLDRITVPDPIVSKDEKCPTRPTTHLCVPHAVHYDSAVERWFADIRLTRAKDFQPNRNPFVQLALVAVQPNGVGGPTQSEPVVCDPVKMIGDRVLEVDRKSAGDFRITLSGSLDQSDRGKNGDAVPFRVVVARIEARDARMPELEVLALPESTAAYNPPHRTRVLSEVELPGLPDGSHAGQLTVDPELLHPKNSNEVIMLVVIEHEFHATSDTAQAGRDEDAYRRRNEMLFAGQNVFTGIVWLHDRWNP